MARSWASAEDYASVFALLNQGRVSLATDEVTVAQVQVSSAKDLGRLVRFECGLGEVSPAPGSGSQDKDVYDHPVLSENARSSARVCAQPTVGSAGAVRMEAEPSPAAGSGGRPRSRHQKVPPQRSGRKQDAVSLVTANAIARRARVAGPRPVSCAPRQPFIPAALQRMGTRAPWHRCECRCRASRSRRAWMAGRLGARLTTTSRIRGC